MSIGDDGRRVPYATKSFFGEECLASGDAAPCTITAVGESVTCLVLDATAFASLETDLEQKLVAAAQAKQEKSRRLSMARRLSRGGAGGGEATTTTTSAGASPWDRTCTRSSPTT